MALREKLAMISMKTLIFTLLNREARMSDITQPVRILISTSHSPHFNLAVEEVIFRNMDPRQTVLFLWRNDNVVVIGRGQNPWKECNTRLMEEDDIMLARRHSGGGAVFQDLGNSCFTFMAGKIGRAHV